MRLLICCLTMFSGLGFAGSEELFDGRSLNGWRVDGAPYWSVEEGVLVGQSDMAKKNSVLWTDQRFRNFSLSFEFRFSGDVDSGVFLRQENDQIQIGVSRSLKRDMTGSPYIAHKRGYPKEAEEVDTLLNVGAWNEMRIVSDGNAYTVYLNGSRVVAYRSDSAIAEGPIGLQVHPGVMMRIEFRDLQITRLHD